MRLLAVLALVVATTAACATTSQVSEGTLPPLAGAPTTLSLADVSTTAVDSAGPSVAPSTVGVATTTTTAPATTLPNTGGGWGGWPYYEVPQLGTENVRGSGCGSSGGLGDVVPDGTWNVIIGDGTGADEFWSGGQISLDLRCVYGGDAGRSQWNTVCSGAPQSRLCASQSPDWFVVNSSRRLRTMPVAADVQYGVGALGTSPCPGVSADPSNAAAPWRSMDSWVVVTGGTVTAVVTACPVV